MSRNDTLRMRAGLFVVALFVLVKPLYYTQSCLTSIFYIAAVLVVQQVLRRHIANITQRPSSNYLL